MRSTHLTDTVTVWLNAEKVPVRLLWRGVRYQVTDRPTLREDLVLGITHPPRVDGWRFRGTNSAGDSLVLDIKPDPLRQEWELVNVYS